MATATLMATAPPKLWPITTTRSRPAVGDELDGGGKVETAGVEVVGPPVADPQQRDTLLREVDAQALVQTLGRAEQPAHGPAAGDDGSRPGRRVGRGVVAGVGRWCHSSVSRPPMVNSSRWRNAGVTATSWAARTAEGLERRAGLAGGALAGRALPHHLYPTRDVRWDSDCVDRGADRCRRGHSPQHRPRRPRGARGRPPHRHGVEGAAAWRGDGRACATTSSARRRTRSSRVRWTRSTCSSSSPRGA